MNNNLLLSDTVGFIDKLPTTLVAAFRATLEEIEDSNLIIHVLDISDKELNKKFNVLEKELRVLETKFEEQSVRLKNPLKY